MKTSESIALEFPFDDNVHVFFWRGSPEEKVRFVRIDDLDKSRPYDQLNAALYEINKS
jgi:hypothetical protein